MRTLKWCADAYFIELGHYPQTDTNGTWFEKLVAADFLHAESTQYGTTPDGSWPIDCFDQRLVYEVINPIQPDSAVVRSIGHDGIDDHGAGDDWDTRFGPNLGYWYKARWVEFVSFIFTGWLIALSTGWVIWRKTHRALISLATTCLIAGIVVGVIPVFVFAAGVSHTRYPQWAESIHVWTALGVPLAILLFIAIGVVNKIRAFHQDVRQRRQDRGLCAICSYDLCGEISRGCPECGWNRSSANLQSNATVG